MIKQNIFKNKGPDTTASSGGGVAGSLNSTSFESLFRVDARLKEYPATLNFYTIPPQEQITLYDFEKLALDRLMVLLAIDSARIRAKTDQDVLKLIEPVVTKHLDLKRNNAIVAKLKSGVSLYDQRQRDHFSHFILRLAYCKTPELQSWFIKQEVALFRLRFLGASNEEKEYLISQAKLDLSPCTFEQLVEVFIKMYPDSKEKMPEKDRIRAIQTIRAVYGDCQTFYKVPFEHVFELVQKRQVIIHDGFAFVPETERVVLVLNHYKIHLQEQLSITAKALPRLDEDDRLMPILYSIAKQSLSKEYQMTGAGGAGHEVRADDVQKLVQHFPPCMSNLHSNLVKDAHLKHNARIQYGLFLKGVGLSLDEALIFWRRSFSKMNDDEFQKKGYVYNIRYNYGMEGKRTNYTPYSCLKMIQSLPGPGDSHGCPFRYFSNEKLGEMMQNLGLDLSTSHQVVSKAKEGHYQLACTRLFEVTRGKIHAEAMSIETKRVKTEEGSASADFIAGGALSLDSDGNVMLLEPIDHPNKFFDLSYTGKSRRKMAMKVENGDGMDMDLQ